MTALIAIILTGLAILLFIRHPIKSLKYIATGLLILTLGILAWTFLFMVLLQVGGLA